MAFEHRIAAISPRPPTTTEHLTPAQRVVVQIMRDRQFGRLENFRVEGGQPVLGDARIVDVHRLDGGRSRAGPPGGEHWQLKQPIRDLFTEFARLQNCLVVRLGFRHGLPVQLETAPLDNARSEPAGITSRLLPLSPRGSRRRSHVPAS